MGFLPMVVGRVGKLDKGASINLSSVHITLKKVENFFSELFAGELKNAFLWIPVLLSIGILLYFNLTSEPSFEVMIGLGILLIPIGVLLFKCPQRFRFICWAIFFLLLGFESSLFRAYSVDAPILKRAVGPIKLVGQVEHLEQIVGKDWRLIVRPDKLGRFKSSDMPYRIRLRSKTKIDPNVVAGSWIETLVRIMPPPGPSHPLDHDFSRDAYFDRVGGTGFTLADIKLVGADYEASSDFTHRVNRIRNLIKTQIDKAIEGQSGAIATALTAGLRGGIEKETTEAMRVAGLAHLLAISGLHMALVTGILFLSIRAAFAAIPFIALNYPIKQMSALIAWGGGLGYYFLSGGSISTARAFLMVTIVLVAVFLNRKPLSMRLVGFAAIFILLTSPEALLTPGFQMSFSAVIGLVAGFEYLIPWFAKLRRRYTGYKGLVLVYLLSIVISTLIAEVTIGPIAAWHFQKLTFYGLLANLLAAPFMAFLVMPLGVLALILVPVGLDGLVWPLMGWGVDQILSIAHWTASLPYAVVSISPLGTGFILLFGLGLVWVTFIETPKLKKFGFVPIILGLISILITRPMPNVLVSNEGKLIAIKGPNRAYYFNSLRTNRYARGKWITQNNRGLKAFTFTQLEQLSNDNKLSNNNIVKDFFECDNLGCRFKSGPNIISLVFLPEALERDCLSSDLIITALSVPRSCAPPKGVIGSWQFRTEGAHSLSFDYAKGDIKISSAYKARGNRPWVNPKPKVEQPEE